MREGLMAEREEEGGSAVPGGDVAPTRPDLRAVAPAADRYTDWREVYGDNVVRIHRLMYAKVGNRPDAEDLTAEVFVAVLNRIRITAHRAEVRAYLAATARTVLAGYWRRRLGAEVTTVDVAGAERFLTEAPPPPPSWRRSGGGGSAWR